MKANNLTDEEYFNFIEKAQDIVDSAEGMISFFASHNPLPPYSEINSCHLNGAIDELISHLAKAAAVAEHVRCLSAAAHEQSRQKEDEETEE